ncbi:MAG: histidine--tRNA ligase [Chloroflexi bacterium]|nr:histidine--tRNA ligase [Chloroflexota bacterium]MDA1227373.1 histidine--tRNA ligase [Chloroflexota bacterium]
MCAKQTERVSVGPISGFPEWTPAERILEQRMLDTIRASFERYGFSPIETPSVERNDVLTAKGGAEAERQIYRLTSLYPQSVEDAREYSLHFDLTVPLARYVAQRYGDLVFPFRRYQIQKVWRGERPQHGRFREFTQCDIDIVGDGELGLMADAEIPAVISEVFSRLDIGNFCIRISNRKILTGYLEHLGYNEVETADILREADKIERQGVGPVREYLEGNGADASKIDGILELVQAEGSSQEILASLKAKTGIGDRYEQGVSELSTVVEFASSFGIPEANLQVDLGIIRGLDYYTGTIYETRLLDHPQLGSICSGGRYDDLASYYVGRTLPGVGISIGLSRLFSQLLRADILQAGAATVAPVLVTTPDESLYRKAIEIASDLRSNDISTEIYFEKARLARQLRYASRKGFKVAVIPLDEDLADGKVRFRDMESGDEQSVLIANLSNEIAKLVK